MEQSKFILEVQSRMCIWNPRVISNYDRIIKRQAWEEVAAKMYDNFHNFSDDEKREAVLELHRKWKSLTDYYKRRNTKEDIDEKTKRTKPIVELLQFLDKIPAFAHTNYSNSGTCKQAAHKHKSADEFHIVEDNITGHESNMNFLQMLLEELQCLNDQQRFKFKLGVMKLIKKIKYDDYENTFDQTDTTQHDQRYDRSIAPFESPPRLMSSNVDISQCNGQINPAFIQTNTRFDMSAGQPELDAADFSRKMT